MKKKISNNVEIEITESGSVYIETRVDYKDHSGMQSDIGSVHLTEEESLEVVKTIKNAKKRRDL